MPRLTPQNLGLTVGGQPVLAVDRLLALRGSAFVSALLKTRSPRQLPDLRVQRLHIDGGLSRLTLRLAPETPAAAFLPSTRPTRPSP